METAQEPGAAQGARKPTEAEPQSGCAILHLGGREISLSEGVWWVEEDGDYVIRSREFDVIAGAPTFHEALSKFIDNLHEFALYLAGIEDPAENEEEMFHRLAPRLLRVSREFERCLESRPKRGLLLLRRRGRKDAREWHPSSRQLGSRLPSHA